MIVNRIFASLFLVFILVAACSPLSGISAEDTEENSVPTLSGNVTPRTTYGGAMFLFTVTYKDADNDTAVYVRVVVDGVSYDMEEVNPYQTNYSAGKDYHFRMSIPEGPAMFYFVTSDGQAHVTTTVQTLHAQPVGMFTGEHQDIVYFTLFVTPLFLAAIAALVLQTRGLKKAVRDLKTHHADTGKEKIGESSEEVLD